MKLFDVTLLKIKQLEKRDNKAENSGFYRKKRSEKP